MIRNQWYVILESKEIKPGKVVGVRRMGERLVLWREAGGKLGCAVDFCPHRGARLSQGQIIGECVECPFHGFIYDPSGACKLIPANGRNAQIPKAFHLQSYPVQEAHGWVYLWWGATREDLPPLPYFESISEDFSSRTIQDHWATHYSRAIENQLDVVHLPFIHKTTIGRGNRTLVNGPFTRSYSPPDCSGDRLDLWVYNEVDNGQVPKKPAEIPTPERHPALQFIFPNLWHNWISDDLRIVVAFVPVDAENSILYLRGYQKMVRLPVLRELMNLTNSLANLIIERQDRRVVIFQEPKASDLRMGEKLIQGDGPIIEYRRRRKALQEAAVTRERGTDDA